MCVAARKVDTRKPNRPYACADHLVIMAAKCAGAEDVAVVGAAVLSMALLLRVSEVASVRVSHIRPPFVRTERWKNGFRTSRRHVSPYLCLWLEHWLRYAAARGATANELLFPLGGPWIRSKMQALLEGSALLGDQWHSWRRSGAFALFSLGAPWRTIMGEGGWETEAMAKHYATPTEDIQFSKAWRLPYPPTEPGGAITLRKGLVSTIFFENVRATFAKAPRKGGLAAGGKSQPSASKPPTADSTVAAGGGGGECDDVVIEACAPAAEEPPRVEPDVKPSESPGIVTAVGRPHEVGLPTHAQPATPERQCKRKADTPSGPSKRRKFPDAPASIASGEPAPVVSPGPTREERAARRKEALGFYFKTGHRGNRKPKS